MTADILLTGAQGQLGWELQRRALAAGLTVDASDRDDLDITDAGSVRARMAAVRPALVVNAAAYTAVDKAESDREAAFAVNRDGPANLAGACAEHAIPLIHVSTDYVFDGSRPGAYREDDPVAPLGVYGISKFAGEEAVRAACPQHVILRTAWVYGVHGHNFVKTMLRLGRERDSLRVVDDQHGCPTFAGDLADAVLAIAARLRAGDLPAQGWGTFHCTGSGHTSWCGFAREIFAQVASRWDRIPEVQGIASSDYPTPARRPANSVLDCSRLEHAYGIRLRDWRPALTEMLDATLAQNGD
ncbi:dTDP-4-dehydrorhamnose reductase [Thioalkalivibrio sp.]|uniref:dTDP-4-dehydrorhamnose reductase n=1 Tax=Thioalkalivibrio sp. TaxID=2093813 RepID=UPI0039768119